MSDFSLEKTYISKVILTAPIFVLRLFVVTEGCRAQSVSAHEDLLFIFNSCTPNYECVH